MWGVLTIIPSLCVHQAEVAALLTDTTPVPTPALKKPSAATSPAMTPAAIPTAKPAPKPTPSSSAEVRAEDSIPDEIDELLR
jgi:hypothetical protein